jgi:hypothetical protein
LISFDRDYLDDRKFPPGESGGVIILTAPEERGYIALLKRLDAEVFQRSLNICALPFEGRKVHVHVDWAGDTILTKDA